MINREIAPCRVSSNPQATSRHTLSGFMVAFASSIIALFMYMVGWSAPKPSEIMRTTFKRERCVHSDEQRRYEGEAVEELHDAIAPMYDQMETMLLWRCKNSSLVTPAR
jgi:hypothetical protein